jgi:hypothetical protein
MKNKTIREATANKLLDFDMVVGKNYSNHLREDLLRENNKIISTP